MQEPSPYVIRHPAPVRREEEMVLNGSLEEEIRVGDYWRVMKTRVWLIAAFFLGVLLVAVLGLFLITPTYTAQTTLLIERRTPQVLDIQEVLSEVVGPLDENDYYKTQYEVLKSRSLAAQVIKEQGLEAVFAAEAQAEGWLATVQASIKAWLTRFFPAPPQSSGGRLLGVNSDLIDTYIDDKLEITPISRTRLVQVAFSASDPELAARVANAHARAYVRQGLGMRNRISEEAQNFLQEHLVELKQRVEKSEAALNRYRKDKKIISLDDKENIVVERLADLNKRLTEAEAERIALAGQVHLVNRDYYDSLPAVIDNPLIHNLKDQLARLEADQARLSVQFTADYPRMAQLTAQVGETQRSLQREIQRIVDATQSAYLAAQAKEKELRTKMEEQKAAALSLKDAAVEYAILAREVDTNLQLYNSVLQRMKEMGVTAELRASNVFVIDEAEPPLEPSKPQKLFTLLLSSLVGLMGGVGLAFFAEYLDNTLKTPQEAERYLQLPTLGVVPDFDGWKRLSYVSRRLPPSVPQPFGSLSIRSDLVLAHHPLSMVTEAYRAIRTAILLSRAEEPPKTILVTSGAQGEGKTVTALNTAILFAQMGARVLVVDADLRRSGCHETLGIRNGLGLTEVLTGQREPEEVIKSLPVDHLSLLTSGSMSPNPTELVGSRKMRETLARLQEQYDYILIDSPPVMLASDAVLLSTMVDGVMLVVNGQKTPKQTARETRLRLNYARANIFGVVLNQGEQQTQGVVYA